jgi:hypothetical protein
MHRLASKLFLTDSQKDHLFVQKIFAPEKNGQPPRPLKKDLHLRKLAHQSHASACTKNYAAYLRLKHRSLDQLAEAEPLADLAGPMLQGDLPFEPAVSLE